MYYGYFDVEKQTELETKRESVMLSEDFQKWKQELNVSRSYVDPSGMYRANELNSQYDYTITQSKPLSSFFNFLNLKGIW